MNASLTSFGEVPAKRPKGEKAVVLCAHLSEEYFKDTQPHYGKQEKSVDRKDAP